MSTSPKPEVPYGTLDLLILKTLDTLGAMHGDSIARRIEQVSESLVRLSQGSIYPALIRLEQQGWIRSEWRVTDGGRDAKFYTLTRAGRTQLQKELAQWERLSNAVGLVIRLAPETAS